MILGEARPSDPRNGTEILLLLGGGGWEGDHNPQIGNRCSEPSSFPEEGQAGGCPTNSRSGLLVPWAWAKKSSKQKSRRWPQVSAVWRLGQGSDSRLTATRAAAVVLESSLCSSLSSLGLCLLRS